MKPYLTLAATLGGLLALLHGLHTTADAIAGPRTSSWSAHPRAVCAGFDPSGAGTGPAARDPVVNRVRTTLGRGGTLVGALERLGLPPAEGSRVAASLATALDPTRLPASTGLVAGFDGDRALRSVSVRAEATRFVRWRDGDVEVVELPLRISVEHADGRVSHSVAQALEGRPWAGELTLAFADIFQWDVDLLVDPRVGDRVRVVYEVQVLGPVPADLPSFGEAADTPGQPLGLGRVLAASFDGSVARSVAYWVERPEGAGDYYDADGTPLRKTFLRSPLTYRRISSGFSRARRNPVTRKVVPHHGVDFAAAPGTPVVAAADGRVIEAGWRGSLGRAVRVRHGSEYVTVYGHLSGFARGIRTGSEVKQNQVIGYVGSTGRATGPHLHYTLIHRGRAIDPLRAPNPTLEPLPAELLPSLERARLAWAPLLGADPLLAGTPAQDDPGLSERRGI